MQRRPLTSVYSGAIGEASLSVVTPVTMPSTRTRLPKLELQKFKGNATDWMSFWDSFKSAIHDNPDISKIDKFNYLCSLLEGTANKVMQGLTLTEANYDSARGKI